MMRKSEMASFQNDKINTWKGRSTQKSFRIDLAEENISASAVYAILNLHRDAHQQFGSTSRTSKNACENQP
jgi:hypothetical protein